MAKEFVITEELQAEIKKLIEEQTRPLVSQFEKLKAEVIKVVNKNVETLEKRSEATEKTVDELVTALNILESDVRAIGGKGLDGKHKPKPIAKDNKSKFAFTLLDLAD